MKKKIEEIIKSTKPKNINGKFGIVSSAPPPKPYTIIKTTKPKS
jgi:hypothetical protein